MAMTKVKSSFSVEAALVVPLALLVMLPFLYLLRMTVLSSILETSMESCLHDMAIESYLIERAGILPDETVRDDDFSLEDAAGKEAEVDRTAEKWSQIFDADTIREHANGAVIDLLGQWYLKEQMQKDLADLDLEGWGVKGGWQGITFLNSRFFYQDQGHGYLLKGSCRVLWQDPFAFWKVPDTTITRLTHAFIGEKDPASSANKGDDGQDIDKTVYRIGQGNKYHTLDCYLLKKDISALARQQAEEKGLRPCSRCGGGEGGLVYRTGGGETFHSQDCPYLFPDLTPMSEDEAIGIGLGPCGLCIGGENYFR